MFLNCIPLLLLLKGSFIPLKVFFLLAVGYSGSSSEDGLSKLQSNALTDGGGAP